LPINRREVNLHSYFYVSLDARYITDVMPRCHGYAAAADSMTPDVPVQYVHRMYDRHRS